MISNGRDIIRAGYAAGLPVSLIAVQCESTPGSVRVIAHNMGIRHARYVDVKIPADKRDDYRNIVQKKCLPEAYARRVLGLEVTPHG